MIARMVSRAGCSICDKLKTELLFGGYTVEVINEKVISSCRDRDLILAALAENDMAVPLVQYPGENWKAYKENPCPQQ